MRFAEAEDRIASGELPVVLVTLYAPGFTVRVASEPLEVDDPAIDGPYFYDARLASVDSFDREIDLFALERAEITRARVRLYLGPDNSPGSLELTWHHLAASRCEVARIWPGQAWKARDVLIGRGTISGLRLGGALFAPDEGASGRPMEFVVEALPPAIGNEVGDSSRSIPGQTVGVPGIRGKSYPWIIGRCYNIPVLRTATNAGIIAGHHFADTTAPTLYEDEDAVENTTFTPAGTISITNGADSLNDPQATIASTSADFANVITFDATNGGIQGVDGQGAALGADGVIAYLLAASGERVDFREMRRTYALLQGLDVGVYMDKAANSLDVLRKRLLPFLPLIEEQGEDGIWLRYTDIASQAPEVELVEGVNLIGFTGAMEQVSDPDDIMNSFTINYAYDHASGRYLKSYTVDGDNHPLCRISEQLYGKRVAPALDWNCCWHDRTAAFSAWSRMTRLALPRFALTAIAEPSLYWLREGAIVRLTSTTYGIEGRKAVIRKARITQNPPRFVIEPIPGTLTTEAL